MSDLLETLRQEGVDPALLEAVQQYRAAHALPDAVVEKQPKLEGRSMQMFLAPAKAQ